MYISRNRRRVTQEPQSTPQTPQSVAPPTRLQPQPIPQQQARPTPQQQTRPEPDTQIPPRNAPLTPPTDISGRSSQIQPSIPPILTPLPKANTPQAPSLTGMGYVIVRVTTASGAIPLGDALVTVRDYPSDGNGNVISTQRTNSSGLTERIALPAPSRSLTQSPGNAKGYKTYNIQVDKEGYNKQLYINVPIFDGVTAVQSADLVPLSENGHADRADPYSSGIFYETENPSLESRQENS